MTIPQNREYVILLHGMARTKSSMGKLENYLTRQGYQVMNEGVIHLPGNQWRKNCCRLFGAHE
ncbi:MAG: hypothetical protein R2860_09095 [Desulfobacterales bacterium]